VTHAMHVREAERLVNKSVDGACDYPDTADATTRLAWATQAQVHATLALVASMPAVADRELPPKVWVATVFEYGKNQRPAVYVSPTEDDLMAVVRKQQGVDYNADVMLWMDRKGRVLNIDSYYVENADD